MTDKARELAETLRARAETLNGACPSGYSTYEDTGFYSGFTAKKDNEAAALLLSQADEIDRLREALKPFAEQADTHSVQMPDQMFIDDYEHEKGKPWVSFAQIRIGDLRRARKKVGMKEGEDDV